MYTVIQKNSNDLTENIKNTYSNIIILMPIKNLSSAGN